MSYKSLKIWMLARNQSLEIHKMTMTLPRFELYETGQQIRRSSKSTRSTIVEGYGRKRYKADYIKFLIYSLSSNDETIDHLEVLFETDSLKDEVLYRRLHDSATQLGKMINNFIQAVERDYQPKPPSA